MGMMRGIVPACNEAIMGIKPIIRVFFQVVAPILFIQAKIAAISENDLKFEGIEVHSKWSH